MPGGEGLLLDAETRASIVEHGTQVAPEEACGVLGGKRRGPAQQLTITRSVPTENIADTPATAYEIAPARALDAIERIEAAGLEHIGFYHSHPAGPATPSPTDRADATWTGYTYLIVGRCEAPRLRAWRYTGETFEEQSLTVVES